MSTTATKGTCYGCELPKDLTDEGLVTGHRTPMGFPCKGVGYPPVEDGAR